MNTEKVIKDEHLEFIGKTTELDKPDHLICGLDTIEVEMTFPTSSEAYEDWINGIYWAAFETWHEAGKDFDEPKDFKEKESRLINLLKKRRIRTVLESITFNFRLFGISRSITHQIVRHRKMAFGQQSMRVADASHSYIRMPQALIANKDELRLYSAVKEHYQQAKIIYYQLIKKGIPREQARMVLPMGIPFLIS